jgi:hypothetical protein
MLSLISLLLLPILFIVSLLFVSNNYQIGNIYIKSNRIKHVILLEESSFVLPYILSKHYFHILNVRSNLIPSLITTSYWYENMQLIREKGFKLANELKIKLLKRVNICLALILYGLIILF